MNYFYFKNSNFEIRQVLYRLFDSFAEMGEENIQVADVALGATSFLVVSLGGVVIGLVFGFIATITTKYTEKTPILEPLIVITYAYLAYLTAEMTSTSSILAYKKAIFYIPLKLIALRDFQISINLIF